jgi:hypothetical protein
VSSHITLELGGEGIYDVPNHTSQLRRFRFVRFYFDAMLYDVEAMAPTTEGWLEFVAEPRARRSRDTFAPMIDEQSSLVVAFPDGSRLPALHVRWTSLKEQNRGGHREFEAHFTLTMPHTPLHTGETEELG